MQRKASRKMTRLAKAARRKAPLQSASDDYVGDERGLVEDVRTQVETQADKLADMAKALRGVQL